MKFSKECVICTKNDVLVKKNYVNGLNMGSSLRA